MLIQSTIWHNCSLPVAIHFSGQGFCTHDTDMNDGCEMPTLGGYNMLSSRAPSTQGLAFWSIPWKSGAFSLYDFAACNLEMWEKMGNVHTFASPKTGKGNKEVFPNKPQWKVLPFSLDNNWISSDWTFKLFLNVQQYIRWSKGYVPWTLSAPWNYGTLVDLVGRKIPLVGLECTAPFGYNGYQSRQNKDCCSKPALKSIMLSALGLDWVQIFFGTKCGIPFCVHIVGKVLK